MLRRTPCIGICSTTYGDLVCRGCKRFAHEIVGWNGYDRGQRGAVWDRLLALRAGATRHVLMVIDEAALRAARPVPAQGEAGAPDLYLLAYETLRWLVHEQPAGLAAAAAAPAEPAPGEPAAAEDSPAAVLRILGLQPQDAAFDGPIEALLTRIDHEFYQRSLAQYERNYRTPAA